MTLTDGAALQNDEAIQLTVSKNVLSKNLKPALDDYSKTWVFADKVAPTITKIVKDGNDVKVTFDDYVSEVAIAKVNGVDKTSSVAAISGLTKTVTITGGVSGLGNGTYSVLLSGVKDAAGNVSSVLNGTVTVSDDAVAPTVSKVEQTGDQQLKVTFSKDVTLVGSEQFVVTKNGYKLVVTPTKVDNKTYTLDLGDAGTVTVYDAGKDTSAVVLNVSGFKGTSNDLVGNTYTTALTLSKDKTAPTVVTRFNAITDIDATAGVDEVFDIYFNEEITLVGNTTNITLIDPNGIRQTVSGVSVAKDGNNENKILRVASTAVQNNGAIKSGTYTLNLSAGLVKDAANNSSAATNVTITKSASASNVTATASADENVITVNYTAPMTTSATTLANYMLDGKALPAGTLIFFDGNSQTVSIELPDGSVKSTGGAVLTIADAVVSTAGNKLTSASRTLNIADGFVDNVKPTLISAKKLSSTQIELSFDENIDDATIAGTAADNDFVVRVNGVTFAYTTTSGAGVNDNKILLTTTSPFNTAQAVTVTVTDVANDISVADAAGNTLKLGTNVNAN